MKDLIIHTNYWEDFNLWNRDMEEVVKELNATNWWFYLFTSKGWNEMLLNTIFISTLYYEDNGNSKKKE